MRLLRFLICATLLLPNSISAQPSTDSRRAKEQAVRKTLDKIKEQCGITTGQFSYDADGIRISYDGMIEPEKLDCARDLTVLVGVPFESYDTSAPYSGPRRFIVKGRSKRVDAVAAAVLASRWTITHRADGPDGFTFLEIETGENLSRREVSEFLDRFRNEFRDIPVGLSPMTLAGYDVPAPATAFRASARHMYEALNKGSCGTPAGFDRDALLKPDRDAVATLEQELSTTIAGKHLTIAREDAEYELSKKPHSCWADDDLRFAKKHAEMVHESVSGGVARLKQLAPAVDPIPALEAPRNAAEFRYHVRELIEWTQPLCRWTTKGSNDAIFAAALREISLFEDRLRGSPYAVHYAVAKEDAAYERSQKVAECDDPGSDPVSKLSARTLATAKKQIGQIEKLVVPL